MTSDNRLRVGIIGLDWHVAFNHVPHFRDTGRAEIVATERLLLAKKELDIAKAYPDWREMLDQAALDAVVICTPNNLHAEPTIAVLERGLHVLIEKPMALTSQDSRLMIQAAKHAKRVLMVGYNARRMASW